MVEQKANTLQTSDSSHLQAIPVVKRPRSVKAPMVKAQVISKRTQGQSINSISKDLGITRNTTRVILNEANFDQEIEAGRIGIVKLIPEMVRVAQVRLAQNSENMALRLLESTILPIGKAGKPGDPGLTLAIQNLMGNITVQSPSNQQDKPVNTAIEADATVSPSPLAIVQTSPQVVENKDSAS